MTHFSPDFQVISKKKVFTEIETAFLSRKKRSSPKLNLQKNKKQTKRSSVFHFDEPYEVDWALSWPLQAHGLPKEHGPPDDPPKIHGPRYHCPPCPPPPT